MPIITQDLYRCLSVYKTISAKVKITKVTQLNSTNIYQALPKCMALFFVFWRIQR